jgi:hypothetical protein
MNTDGVFDGFMPTITDVTISKETPSITSKGDLMSVHCVTIKANEKEYIFSIQPENLQKLYFLILKTLI